VLLISIGAYPDGRNYPRMTFEAFDAEERKALRAALLKVRKKREARNKSSKYD
jgi:hypothetical protein